MIVIIELDETLTVSAHIEGNTTPSQPQCLALRDIAAIAGRYRGQLLSICTCTPEIENVTCPMHGWWPDTTTLAPEMTIP